MWTLLHVLIFFRREGELVGVYFASVNICRRAALILGIIGGFGIKVKVRGLLGGYCDDANVNLYKNKQDSIETTQCLESK